MSLRIGLPAASGIEIELFRLPGLSVFGKTRGVRRGLERLLSHDAGSLVMTMTVRRSSAEARHDNLRTELPNDADEISKQCVSPPLFKSLVRTLGETELINRRKELLCVIGPASRKKFLGADNA